MKRILSWLLLLCLLLPLFCACASQSFVDIFSDGADRFSDGKEEKDYSLKDAGAKLQAMIDGFSGSYQVPTGSSISWDDYDKDKKGHHTAGGQDSETGDGDEEAPVVSGDVCDWDDILRLFHAAYDGTEEYVEFTPDGGVSFVLNDVEKIYRLLQREDPYDVCALDRYSLAVRDSRCYVRLYYAFETDALKEMKKETRTLVKEAVSSLDSAGKNEYELALLVNDYLCDNFIYPDKEPYAAETHMAYGGLKHTYAVCEGYACAAKMMLNEMGVSCDIEIGNCRGGGGHAWNLVQVDGRWYQMDVTWNDGGGDRMTYFLVTDEYMRQSRSWNEADYPSTPTIPYEP